MPVYEFRCRTCDDRFELSRPMSQASDPATCPSGHEGAVKLLSRVMVLGRTAGESEATTSAGAGPMGGCCGGGCGCH